MRKLNHAVLGLINGYGGADQLGNILQTIGGQGWQLVIEPNNNGTNNTSFDVGFRKHDLDTDLVVSDLTKIVSIVNKDDIIKLQGGKKKDEINSLVLGHALTVVNALK